MFRVGNVNRTVAVALLLGSACLVFNFLSSHSGIEYIRVGDIFLFISAGALGISGVFISLACGLLPEVFLNGSYLEFVRTLALCFALGYCADKLPKVPPYIVGLGLWLICFFPILGLLSKYSVVVDGVPGVYAPSAPQLLIFAMSEILLILISGALLINKSIWGLLSHKPRQTSVENLLAHSLTLVSGVLTFVALRLIEISSFTAGETLLLSAPQAVCLVVFLSLTLPSLASWRLGEVLRGNQEELLGKNLLLNSGSKHFCGQPVNYWKRQSNADFQPTSSSSSLFTTSVGIVPPALTAVDGSKKPEARDQGICALNRDGTITFLNRRFVRYTELKHNEPLGRRLDSVGMNPAFCKHITELLERTFSKGARVTELKINQIPNSLRFYEVSSILSEALKDSSLNSGPDSIIISVHDITDRRTVETQLLESQKLGSLGIMVSNIAHSFNNLLTAMLGQASFALRTQKADSREKALKEIVRAAENAGKLVNQLVEFADCRPGLVKPQDLNQLLSTKLGLLEKVAGARFELNYKCSGDPICAAVDENLLTQALTNLVTNACDSYEKGQGAIEISLQIEELDDDICGMQVGARPGKFARLRVQDRGCGMNNEELAHAFDPLYMSKQPRHHSNLGLSIVFAVVRAHDGFLTAESKPEKGTTISLYFPLVESISASENQVENNGDPTIDVNYQVSDLDAKSKGILVVEDDEFVRQLIVQALNGLGYRVNSCTNGDEALTVFQAENFDMLVVDMMMPKMNGLNLINRLREGSPELKALMITGYGASVDCPGVPTLAKPFDVESLAQAVSKTLGSTAVSETPQKKPFDGDDVSIH